MRFTIPTTIGRDVLFTGSEQIDGRDWSQPGRWKLDLQELQKYVAERVKNDSFGESVTWFLFCFEIFDFELSDNFYTKTATYTSYRPKNKEYFSVGQLRWSDVKNLPLEEQFSALRSVIRAAVLRGKIKPRRPKSFDFDVFASSIDQILSNAPISLFALKPSPTESSMLVKTKRSTLLLEEAPRKLTGEEFVVWFKEHIIDSGKIDR